MSLLYQSYWAIRVHEGVFTGQREVTAPACTSAASVFHYVNSSRASTGSGHTPDALLRTNLRTRANSEAIECIAGRRWFQFGRRLPSKRQISRSAVVVPRCYSDVEQKRTRKTRQVHLPTSHRLFLIRLRLTLCNVSQGDIQDVGICIRSVCTYLAVTVSVIFIHFVSERGRTCNVMLLR